MDLADTVDDRVAHVHVRRRHVDLGAEDRLAFVELAVGHLLEGREVLLDGRVARGARLAGVLLVAVEFADLVLREEADVGLAELDQLDGVGVHALEVVRSLVVVLVPLEAQPADVFLDGVDVFDLFLGRIRVVHAEVAAALELEGEAEVQADGLRVADVQVAVGFRGEAGGDGRVLTRGQVGVDDLLDEVAVGRRRRGFGRHGRKNQERCKSANRRECLCKSAKVRIRRRRI